MNTAIKSLALSVVAMTVMVACAEQTPVKADQGKTAGGDKAAVKENAREPITLNGAGATFPYPVYAQWAHTYNKVAGTKLNYQSIGSGGGIAQIKAKTVDFGASDAPLQPAVLDGIGLVQFPMVMGGVVPVVNIEGIGAGQLELTKELLADIYLGKIKKWNDKAIKDTNPDLALPDQDIAVVHRADGSGTTWIFTNYLDKVSPEWHEKVGNDKAVEWPTGMGGKGNEGVAAYVQRVKGAIGYVEYAYALQNMMVHARLQNTAGHFVDPTVESFQAAAASADWTGTPGFYVVLTDQPGEKTWPITGATFILMHKDQENAAAAKEALAFFDWCYRHGSVAALDLQYVPMPDQVADLVRDLWKREIKASGNPVWR